MVTGRPNPGFAGSSHTEVGLAVLLHSPLQTSKLPRAKSLSTALTEDDERVSSRKLAKHAFASPSWERSTAPSKKSGDGIVHPTPLAVCPGQSVLLSLLAYGQTTCIGPGPPTSTGLLVKPMPLSCPVISQSVLLPAG